MGIKKKENRKSMMPTDNGKLVNIFLKLQCVGMNNYYLCHGGMYSFLFLR